MELARSPALTVKAAVLHAAIARNPHADRALSDWAISSVVHSYVPLL